MNAWLHTCRPGMCSRTTWSRPRPGVFEAKATEFCPRGRGQSLRTTSVQDCVYELSFISTCNMQSELMAVAQLSEWTACNVLKQPAFQLTPNSSPQSELWESQISGAVMMPFLLPNHVHQSTKERTCSLCIWFSLSAYYSCFIQTDGQLTRCKCKFSRIHCNVYCSIFKWTLNL